MSYRMVVIDDEILVRRGISSGIGWLEHDIEIVGEATDGISGLELIRRTRPHIILTDIRMPHMDGLELIRHVREEYPWAKILILSVLEDFQTVREALRLGVTDYVQKLMMTPEELLGAVLKMKQTVEQESGADTGAEQSFKETDGRPRNKDLCLWLNGGVSSELDQWVDRHGSYAIAKVRFSPRKHMDIGFASEELHQIQERLERRCGFHPASVVMEREENGHIWLLIPRQTEIASSDVLYRSLQPLVLSDDADVRISLGLSGWFQRSSERTEAKAQADRALRLRFFDGGGKVYVLRDEAAAELPEVNGFLNHPLLRTYLHQMEDDDESSSLAFLDQLFPQRVQARCTEKTVREGIYHWVSAVTLFLKERGCRLPSVLPDESPFETISRVETYPELRDWCIRLHQVTRSMLNEWNRSQRSEIVKAIQYTRSHFMKQIRVKDVAEWVNLSENYFSNVFTKETGKTFSQYLQEIRVDKAKELLGGEGLDWIHVGERVGFDNPKYFTKVFKRYAGTTPVQYAKIRRKASP